MESSGRRDFSSGVNQSPFSLLNGEFVEVTEPILVSVDSSEDEDGASNLGRGMSISPPWHDAVDPLFLSPEIVDIGEGVEFVKSTVSVPASEDEPY